MKKNISILSFLAAFALMTTSVYAQKAAIGLDLGTYGLGADVAYKFNDRFALRAGYNFLNLSFDKRETQVPFYTEESLLVSGNTYNSTIDLKADIKLASIFRVWVGAAMAPSKKAADLTFFTDKPIDIAGFTVSPDLIGEINVKLDNKSTVFPQLGISIGRVVPRKVVGISLDLGVLYRGKIEVSEMKSAFPTDKAALQAAFDDETPYYPNATLRVAFKIAN